MPEGRRTTESNFSTKLDPLRDGEENQVNFKFMPSLT
jgi:hypothetical protein